MRATPPYPQRVFMQQRLVTEHARPARDLDLIDAGSRACQVDRLHDGGDTDRHARAVVQAHPTVGVAVLPLLVLPNGCRGLRCKTTMFSRIHPHARRGLAAPRRWMLGHPKPTRYIIPWPTAPEIVRPLANSALLCQLAPVCLNRSLLC